MTGSAARIILGDMLRKVTSVKVRYLAGSYGMLQQKIRIGWSPSVCACIVIFLKHYYAEDRIIITFNTFSYEWAITIVVFLQSKAAFPLGPRLLYSLGTNVNTALFQAPKQEFGHGVSTRVQKSGTGVPVCTPFWLVPGQSIALLSLLSSCFKMTSDMAKVEKLCTQLHIGYSNCEHNIILCRCPGTGCSEPSGDSP